MPKVESLRLYSVAGMDGREVQELTITSEAIVGDRSFAVVLESEIATFIDTPECIPLRMTQTRFPQLTLFQTQEKDARLIITFKGEPLFVDQEIEVTDSTLPFYSEDDSFESTSQALKQRALPFRVSRRSSSQRWAEDCGDEVAAWLSERIGEKVRLVKAVKHPEFPKHHFTWYTALHAVMQSSLDQLAEDTGTPVDELTFRYNIKLSDTEAPFDEETWRKVSIDGIEAVVTACTRCGYIGIERATAVLAHYLQVLQEVSKEHSMNFGVYIEPRPHGALVLRVGDEIRVIEKVV